MSASLTVIHVRLACHDCRPLVDGFEDPRVPGLAITPPSDSTLERGPWRITHVESGLLVMAARSLDHARALLTHLGALGDWTRSAELLREDKSLVAHLRRARAAT